MLHLILMLINLLGPSSNARDAVKYFVEHRKVHNYTFTVLTNMNASDAIWIEYEYYFESKKHESIKAARNIEDVLKVGVFESHNSPFDCKFSYDNDTMEEFTGYSSEVLNLLQETLHFKAKYKKLNYTNEQNLTELLKGEDIDLLICHPEVNYDVEPGIIQLHSTLKSSYVLIYKPSKLHFTKDIFILTFAGTLWLCFLVLLIVLAICLHITTKRYSIVYGYEYWKLLDITLWANAAACQQGLSHTPTGFASRFIFLLGYITSYLLYTGFAAGITSLLLQQGMNNDITTADVEKMKLGVVTLTDMRLTFTNYSLLVADVAELFKYLDQDNTVGIAPKIFVDQHFATKLNYDLISMYATSFLAKSQYSRGFVVLKNSILKEQLNNGLLALQESGLLANALQQSLPPSPTNPATSNYSSAGIEHVGSAILILVVGTLSSTVFLVVELTVALYRSRCYSRSSSGGYF